MDIVRESVQTFGGIMGMCAFIGVVILYWEKDNGLNRGNEQ